MASTSLRVKAKYLQQPFPQPLPTSLTLSPAFGCILLTLSPVPGTFQPQAPADYMAGGMECTLIRGWELLYTVILEPLLTLTWSSGWSRRGCPFAAATPLPESWAEEGVSPAAAAGTPGRLGLHLKGSEALAVSPPGAGIIP